MPRRKYSCSFKASLTAAPPLTDALKTNESDEVIEPANAAGQENSFKTAVVLEGGTLLCSAPE